MRLSQTREWHRPSSDIAFRSCDGREYLLRSYDLPTLPELETWAERHRIELVALRDQGGYRAMVWQGERFAGYGRYVFASALEARRVSFAIMKKSLVLSN